MTDRERVEAGETFLGIEFGSTRIKAVLSDEEGKVLSSGAYGWENRLKDGIWTYDMEDIVTGLQSTYADLSSDVKNRYGCVLKKTGAIGISARCTVICRSVMTKTPVPFRTWRNTTTGERRPAQDLSASTFRNDGALASLSGDLTERRM